MASIAVIGDFMVDKWWCVTPYGVSQDSGCPRYTAGVAWECWGGAGNVAYNLRAMGNHVNLVRSGMDRGVSGGEINTKHRLYDIQSHKQVARWDQNDFSYPITPDDMEVLDGFCPDAIVISDYGKGAVTQAAIEWIRTESTCPVYIDTKRGPLPYTNILDRGPVFFPNAVEYEAHKEEYLKCPLVFLKKGRFGCEFLQNGTRIAEAPATCPHPKSTCGAGDVVIAAAVDLACREAYGVLPSTTEVLESIMTVVGDAIDASEFTCKIREAKDPRFGFVRRSY